MTANDLACWRGRSLVAPAHPAVLLALHQRGFSRGAFFRYRGLQKRELERYALDPAEVTKNAPAPSVGLLCPLRRQTPTRGRSRRRFKSGARRDAPGNGNYGFYRLGLGLLYAGMDDHEIQSLLAEQAEYAHTPTDRRRNIRHVMASLRRRKGQGLGAAAT